MKCLLELARECALEAALEIRAEKNSHYLSTDDEVRAAYRTGRYDNEASVRAAIRALRVMERNDDR